MIPIIKEKILIRPENLKPTSPEFEILGVLNPAAVRLPDSRILLYVRVIEKLKKTQDLKYFYSPRFVGKKEFKIKVDKFRKGLVVNNTDVDFSFEDGTKRLTYISHFRRIFLDKSGFKILKVEKLPGFYGLDSDSELGVEDPRIVKIEDKYYMTYVGLTREGNISSNLAVSENGIDWKRKGVIFGEQDKDVVLFPEKINEKYTVFDRPEGNFEFSSPHMWIAYSKDLEYWGDLTPIHFAPGGNFNRSGAGPPPIKTDKGWLLIFHAVTTKKRRTFWSNLKKFLGFKINPSVGYSREDVYAVWAALFDLRDPRKLISKTPTPIISPNKKHHKSFEGKMVVFPTGIVEDLDGESILLYSGFGDTFVGVQKIKLKDIVNSLER